MIDRNNVLQRALQGEELLCLELGCGDRKRHPTAVGIDLLDFPGVDVVGDVLEVLKALPDACVQRVWSYHFLEHVDSVSAIMRELGRVCAPGAIVEVTVPHFSNPFFYSDPTHRSAFGLYSMSYFCIDKLFSRSVPKYGLQPLFEVFDVKLFFKSPRPRYIRYALKRLIQAMVNSCSWTQELYEELFSFLCPCYELRYSLVRR